MKLIHTADWQIGKPFAGVRDPHKRSLLQEARTKAVLRIGEIAREQEAECVLVAGDLFDTPSATKGTVSAACAAIGEIGLPVITIPGNHDFGGPGSIWEQPYFERERQALAPNLRVLSTQQALELDGAVIFPCPLARRHESLDPTAWLRTIEADLSRYGDKARIVLAHGSVQGFGSEPDDEEPDSGPPNLIDLSRLPLQSFDYVALGDWHGAKEISEKAWYSGTPEPDRFPKGNAPGQALVVTAVRGKTPNVVPVETSVIRWHEISFVFRDDSDLARLEARMEVVLSNRVNLDLVRLRLSGSLGMEATAKLEEKLETWSSRLLRLKLANGVDLAPTEEETDALARNPSDPLIAKVASRLVEMANGNDGSSATARTALRELYSMSREKAR